MALVPCAQGLETRGSSSRLRKGSSISASADARLGSYSLGLCSDIRAYLEPDLVPIWFGSECPALVPCAQGLLGARLT